jgi:Uma2 family endonuclease
VEEKAMLVELRRLSIPPGQHVLLHEVNWQEFESILEELGEHRSTRIAYDNGNLEIMTPLPEHEADKEIIGDLLKALLEELDIEFLTLGSTTFKNPAMLKGIEPDQCFYIQNESAVRGKKRLDLTVDPPPDLALEIDVTSRTHPTIYQALKVPELWRFDRGRLQINWLQAGIYQESETSLALPNLPLKEAILYHLEQSRTAGRNATMKAFRQWARVQIGRERLK